MPLTLRLGVVLLAAIMLAGCTVNPQDLAPPSKPGGNVSPGMPNGVPAGNNSQGGVPPIPPVPALTMQDVAKHNNKTNCWMVINNEVLDLTYYISHPGGDAYVPFCGTDATRAFNNKGGTGTNHSARAFAMLNSYVIGELGKPLPVGGQNGTSGTGAGNPPPDAAGGNANNTPPPAVNNTPPATPPPNITAPAPILTAEEVAKHNTANDCWMVIYGDVLNLTVFSSHPGGSTYVPFCGTDATAAFDTKGGRGNRHSSGAVADLSLYTIGQLGQPQNRTVNASNTSISGRGEDDGEWEDDEWEDDD